MKTPIPQVERLLISMAEVQQITGLRSRQSIYNKLRQDPTFPRPRRLGAHSVAFLRAEVEAWVSALPIAHLDGFDAISRRQMQRAGATKEGAPA
jgi:predicted DNA-binding transcriptional regulator AlpA